MLLVDTNVWLAAADRGSNRHSECAAVLGDHAGGLASPVSVIAETAWLLLDRGGAAAQGRFVATITAGQLEPVDLLAADWPPDHEVYVACDLQDGAYIGGRLDWYSTELEETADRDFALAGPFTFAKDGEESELAGFKRVILSARQVTRMYVSFILARAASLESATPPSP